MQAAVAKNVKVAVELKPLKAPCGHNIFEHKHVAQVGLRPVGVAQLVLHDDEGRVGEGVHIARVVEMQMGDQDILNVRHLVAERLNLPVEQHLLGIRNLKMFGKRPPVRDRVIRHRGVTAGVEQDQALLVFNQIGRTGYGHQIRRPAVHQQRLRNGQFRVR